MNHSVSDIVVNQFTRSLVGLKGILGKATEFATDRKFKEDNFLDLRLAPDMFPFVRQVQMTTDTAKGAVARLTGKKAPVFEDTEKTMAELQTRVEKTIEFIKTATAEDFKDYKTARIEVPWRQGVHMMGEDYLVSHVIPNFYFHLATTYSILRGHGVALGKQDFLGEQNWRKN